MDYIRTAKVKLQTVQVQTFRFEPGGEDTIGEQINEMLYQSTRSGLLPTKLTLEINPPDEVDEARME